LIIYIYIYIYGLIDRPLLVISVTAPTPY